MANADSISEKMASVRDLTELPALPQIGQIILHDLDNENINIQELAEHIEMDPALTARIIGIANSAYYGCNESIYKIKDAIFRVLGLQTVRSIALSIIIGHTLKPSEKSCFNIEQYWWSALLTALAARNLYRSCSLVSTRYAESNIYLGGKLHNLGHLVLAYVFGDDITRMENYSGNLVFCGYTAGDDAITAPLCGGMLARRWHLPEEICITAEHVCNTGYQGQHREFVRFVQLCSDVAVDLKAGNCDSDKYVEQIGRLDIQPDKFNNICTDLYLKRDEIRDMARLLALD